MLSRDNVSSADVTRPSVPNGVSPHPSHCRCDRHAWLPSEEFAAGIWLDLIAASEPAASDRLDK